MQIFLPIKVLRATYWFPPPQEGAVPVNGLKRDREEVKEEVGGALDRGEKEKFLYSE